MNCLVTEPISKTCAGSIGTPRSRLARPKPWRSTVRPSPAHHHRGAGRVGGIGLGEHLAGEVRECGVSGDSGRRGGLRDGAGEREAGGGERRDNGSVHFGFSIPTRCCRSRERLFD